jgi:hypothetical protein
VAYCPFATVRLLAGPGASRPAIRPTQIAVHTMESTPAAADRRFRRADARGHGAGQSHFGVGRDGRILQWIDTARRADATYQANRRADTTGAVAVATEGRASQPWTEAQLDALVQLHMWLMHTHPAIGRRVCRSAADPGLGHHTLFDAWTAQDHSCPGPLRAAQWREEVVPRVLAAFGVRYGDPTPEQLAEAFIIQLVGEKAEGSGQALSGPQSAGEQTAVPQAAAAPGTLIAPADGPTAAPTPTAPAASPVRESNEQPLHTSPAHVVMHAVRDFFLPDSAPKRENP